MAKPKAAAIKDAVRVRVAGNSPISEDGTTYWHARTEKDAKGQQVHHKADEFVTSKERAEALGDDVEIIGPVEEAK